MTGAGASTTPTSRRELARAARRDALLDAVIGAIRAEGPTVSMDHMAAAGGVTKPILYRHFVDRSGLVSAVAVRFVDGLMSEVLGHLGSDASTRSLLAETLGAYLGFIERDPHVYRFIRSESEPEGLDLMVRIAATEIAVALRQRMEAVGVDAAPAALWAHALTGVALSAGEWLLEDPTLTRDEAIESLTSLLWGGVAAVGLDGPDPTSDGPAAPAPTITPRTRTRTKRAPR